MELVAPVRYQHSHERLPPLTRPGSTHQPAAAFGRLSSADCDGAGRHPSTGVLMKGGRSRRRPLCVCRVGRLRVVLGRRHLVGQRRDLSMEPWDVDQQPPRFLHIYEDGSRDGRDGTRQTVRTQDGLATLLIEIVHLITARGITHSSHRDPSVATSSGLAERNGPTTPG